MKWKDKYLEDDPVRMKRRALLIQRKRLKSLVRSINVESVKESIYKEIRECNDKLAKLNREYSRAKQGLPS